METISKFHLSQPLKRLKFFSDGRNLFCIEGKQKTETTGV